MLVTGRLFQFILVIAIFALYYVYEKRKETLNINIRNIPAMDAIPEAVGRASEMGKPMFANVGGGVGGRARPERISSTLAGYVILGYAAEHCASMGTHLIVSVSQPTAMPVAYETLRTAYLKAGQEDLEPDIRFLGGSQFSHAAGAMGIMKREEAASVLLMGTYGAEALILSEAANLSGAMVIAGTEITYQVAVFVATTDYSVFGEEMFAASASILKDPEELSNIRSRDIAKYLLSGIMLLGSVLAVFGSNIILQLLSW